MMTHLNDRTTCEVLQKDPTTSIERKVKGLLTDWENSGHISPEYAKAKRSPISQPQNLPTN